MLREKPSLSDTAIALCVEHEYGLMVDAVTFLPIGYDPNAAVYHIHTRNNASYFLKLTRTMIVSANLRIPQALIDQGIMNVLAPLPTLQHDLWCTLDSYSLILYPFINGENAMQRGMSDQQWMTFGATLNAIHRSGIEAQFVGEIPLETFASPMIDLVRSMQKQVQNGQFELPVQQDFAAFWQQNTAVIQHLTDRAEQLGTVLQAEQFAIVLCHGDIHAANIMLDHAGELYMTPLKKDRKTRFLRITILYTVAWDNFLPTYSGYVLKNLVFSGESYIIDWDTPRLAPRERDLLFIIGSTIARPVTPREEACFFQGYGAASINWQALTYYRYERAFEELYEGGRSVFLDPLSSVAVKEVDAEFTMSLFQPGAIVQSALEGDKQLAEIESIFHEAEDYRNDLKE